MRLRDRFKFYKQRRIVRKMKRCVDLILAHVPTIDGAFFSPCQLLAFYELEDYCKKLKFAPPLCITNAFSLSNEDFISLKKFRHISAELHNPECVVFRDVQRPEGFKEDKLDEV